MGDTPKTCTAITTDEQRLRILHDEKERLQHDNADLREALKKVDRLIGMNEDEDSMEAVSIIARALANNEVSRGGRSPTL